MIFTSFAHWTTNMTKDLWYYSILPVRFRDIPKKHFLCDFRVTFNQEDKNIELVLGTFPDMPAAEKCIEDDMLSRLGVVIEKPEPYIPEHKPKTRDFESQNFSR